MGNMGKAVDNLQLMKCFYSLGLDHEGFTFAFEFLLYVLCTSLLCANYRISDSIPTWVV